MNKYQDRLIEHLNEKPGFVTPQRYRTEVLALLREPLEDLCISRPRSRLQWGIPLPFDGDYVTYVWFDALINYVSALEHKGGDSFDAYWPCCNHLIAKDILKPHAVFWPTMLMAAGLPLYDRLNVHGYWIMDKGKMSKSLGNVIRPLDMKERYGMDAFRYYLLREMVFGQDAAFSMEAFVNRVNADLANNFGNLVSRVLAMQKRYFGGVVQPMGERRTAPKTGSSGKPSRRRRPTPTGTWRRWPSTAPWSRSSRRWTRPTSTSCRPRRSPSSRTRTRRRGWERSCTTSWRACALPATCWRPSCRRPAPRCGRLLGLPATDTLRAEWGGSFPEGHQVQPPEILFPRIEETEDDGDAECLGGHPHQWLGSCPSFPRNRLYQNSAWVRQRQ